MRPVFINSQNEAYGCKKGSCMCHNLKVLSTYHGRQSTIIVAENGDVYVQGFNDQGIIGMGKKQYLPYFEIIPDLKAISVSSDGYSTLFIDGEGQVYYCGRASISQFGLTYLGARVPRKISGLIALRACISTSFSAFITPENDVILYGYRGRSEHIKIPDIKAKDISIGRNHIMILGFDGRITVLGDNTEGQLGFDELIHFDSPRLLPDNIIAKSISCYDLYSVILTIDGDIIICGWICIKDYGHNYRVNNEPAIFICASDDRFYFATEDYKMYEFRSTGISEMNITFQPRDLRFSKTKSARKN